MKAYCWSWHNGRCLGCAAPLTWAEIAHMVDHCPACRAKRTQAL